MSRNKEKESIKIGQEQDAFCTCSLIEKAVPWKLCGGVGGTLRQGSSLGNLGSFPRGRIVRNLAQPREENISFLCLLGWAGLSLVVRK